MVCELVSDDSSYPRDWLTMSGVPIFSVIIEFLFSFYFLVASHFNYINLKVLAVARVTKITENHNFLMSSGKDGSLDNSFLLCTFHLTSIEPFEIVSKVSLEEFVYFGALIWEEGDGHQMNTDLDWEMTHFCGQSENLSTD